MNTDERLTQIINYVAAISREVGDFRREVGEFRREFNQFRGETEARFERLEAKVDAGFKEVRADIGHLKDKLKVMTDDLMELRTEHFTLSKRVDELEHKQA